MDGRFGPHRAIDQLGAWWCRLVYGLLFLLTVIIITGSDRYRCSTAAPLISDRNRRTGGDQNISPTTPQCNESRVIKRETGARVKWGGVGWGGGTPVVVNNIMSLGFIRGITGGQGRRGQASPLDPIERHDEWQWQWLEAFVARRLHAVVLLESGKKRKKRRKRRDSNDVTHIIIIIIIGFYWFLSTRAPTTTTSTKLMRLTTTNRPTR